MVQKNQLWWDLPAQESFRLHQEIYRIEPQQFEHRRDELVDLLDVRRLLGQPVRELSLGEAHENGTHRRVMTRRESCF